MRDMVGVRPILTIAGLVEDEHALIMRTRGGIGAEEFEPPLVHGLGLPGRFGQEPLQALRGGSLGAEDRLGADQAGERLVALPRQQQPLQVSAEGAALGDVGEQIVELAGVGFERTGGRRARHAMAHGTPSGDPSADSAPPLNKLP